MREACGFVLAEALQLVILRFALRLRHFIAQKDDFIETIGM